MKILLVEDHGVVRAGISRLLSVNFDMTFFEAADVEQAFDIYRSELPDIVVLDLNLEGASGFELMRRVFEIDGAAKFLIFSMHAEPTYAARALKAGARGYVSKSAPVEELVRGVRTVLEGGEYIDHGLDSALSLAQVAGEDPLQTLNSREMEILRLLGKGRSMTAIAGTLGIAYKTVANNCTQMKSKLGVERTADLIRLAVQNLQA